MPHEVNKKRGRRPLSRKMRLLISAAAALAMTAAVFFVLLPGHDQTVLPGVPEAAPQALILSNTSLEEIDRVWISPSVGESYTFLVREDSLVLENHADFIIRESILQTLISNICHVRAERIILDTNDKAVQLDAFGLDPESFSARITYTDGKSDLIRVGSQIQGDEIPYYYFLWNDDSRIFAGGTDMASAFNNEFDYLRSVAQPSIQTDILDRIEIRSEETVILEYRDLGWQILSPFSYPASSKFMDGYLQNIRNLLFSRYLGPAAEADLQAYGLLEPSIAVVLTEGRSILTVPDTDGNTHAFDVPERELRIQIGSAYDSVSYYAEYDGQIYTVSYMVYQLFHDYTADDMRQLNPFQLEFYQIDSIEIRTDTALTEYRFLFEETDAADPGDAYSQDSAQYICRILKDGQEIDAAAFRQWYQNTLYEFLPEGTLPEPLSRSASPVLTVTIANAYAKRTVEFIPYDSLHMAVRVDGTVFDYVSDGVCGRILNPTGF